MGKYLDEYCTRPTPTLENPNTKCKVERMIDNIIRRHFAWLPESTYCDFYSIGMELVWKCENKFDESKDTRFETFLMSCLLRKIKSRITYTNRLKRCSKDEDGNPVQDVSIYEIINPDEGMQIIDTLIGKPMEADEGYSQNMEDYFSYIGNRGKEVLIMQANGFSPQEIRKRLKLSERRYVNITKMIYDTEATSLLKRMEVNYNE